jgi:hypothetical protein
MSERLVERYSTVRRNSSKVEGLYGDSKEVRVMAGNGNDRHDKLPPSQAVSPSPKS